MDVVLNIAAIVAVVLMVALVVSSVVFGLSESRR